MSKYHHIFMNSVVYHFSIGVAVYMTLCILLAMSSAMFDDGIDETVYIEKGAASVILSCGNLPQDAFAIEWFVHKYSVFERIMKFYYKIPNSSPLYSDRYTADKYDIDDSVNTSLVVKNIDLADGGLFQCGTAGGAGDVYSYITKLQVVGKSLLTYYNIVSAWCANSAQF